MPIDTFWYLLGKNRGGKVLNLLCAISLEPDYCVRNTEATFDRFGPLSLVLAKFVPGLQTLAPPMAGMTGMSLPRFLLLDSIGTMAWAGTFLLTGMIFHHQFEAITMALVDFGIWAGIGVAGLLIAYFGWKLVQRRLFLKSLETRRLNPREAFYMMQGNPNVHVIDLRHCHDLALLPQKLPGAVNLPMEGMDRHAHRIPPDSDIIVYCN